MQRLFFTCGDINGIGPEITLKTFNKIYDPSKRRIVYLCPSNVFEQTVSIVAPKFKYVLTRSPNRELINSDKVVIVDLGKAKQKIGFPSSYAGKVAYKSIVNSFQLYEKYSGDAIITAPISKTSFFLADLNFPGQTEIFANLCNSKNYMMVFLSNKIICGLLTIHEPIEKVPKLINRSGLIKSVQILENVLRKDLNIISPKIAVLGLNPHAGENGKIGNEELKIIEPAINGLGKQIVSGPFVPDAFFAMKQYKNYNAVLGMYHDQVLIPFKMMNFNSGVNYTAGLPVIRTSPDHGTAYDIAGKGIADSKSITEAVYWAEKISRNRKKNDKPR